MNTEKLREYAELINRLATGNYVLIYRSATDRARGIDRWTPPLTVVPSFAAWSRGGYKLVPKTPKLRVWAVYDLSDGRFEGTYHEEAAARRCCERLRTHRPDSEIDVIKLENAQ